MIPSEQIGVRLIDGGPEDDDPVLDISLRYDDQMRQNTKRAADRLSSLFATAGLEVQPVGSFEASEPGSSFHYGGTIRMHADPRFGVLDAWNRVYDAPNVIVCDASCFTTGPEKNPTLTAMAIAARAAHRLGCDLSGKPSDLVGMPSWL